jgi:hypothetical protein
MVLQEFEKDFLKNKIRSNLECYILTTCNRIKESTTTNNSKVQFRKIPMSIFYFIGQNMYQHNSQFKVTCCSVSIPTKCSWYWNYSEIIEFERWKTLPINGCLDTQQVWQVMLIRPWGVIVLTLRLNSDFVQVCFMYCTSWWENFVQL